MIISHDALHASQGVLKTTNYGFDISHTLDHCRGVYQLLEILIAPFDSRFLAFKTLAELCLILVLRSTAWYMFERRIWVRIYKRGVNA